VGDCFDKILDPETYKKLFGDKVVSKALLREFVNQIDKIRQASDKAPELGSFRQRVNEFIKQRREFNEITKSVRSVTS
jgi:hypothetical protein